jgi:hypothetical protein
MSKVTNKFEGVPEAAGPLLFYPREKSLKRTYPELDTIPEFEGLTENELLICYYFGVYYDHIDTDLERWKRTAYKVPHAFTDETRASINYGGDKVPLKLRKAIKKMQEFDVKLRFRAKKMTEQILENFEKITNMGAESFVNEEGYSDMASLKQYTDLCISISKELPNIIQKAEAGYGVRVTTLKNNVLIQGSPLDEYIKKTEKL